MLGLSLTSETLPGGKKNLKKVLTLYKIYVIIIIEKGKGMMKMTKKITINFDMDGTIADLYGVENWLEMLTAQDETPYATAKPLIRLCTLARMLNRLQREGYQIAVLTWLAKNATADYNERVATAKREWLAKHMPTVVWDRVTIVEYGTPKENYCETPLDILFDDEQHNRENWNGFAYDADDILGILKML